MTKYDKLYECPICGDRNLESSHSWDICTKCGWEDSEESLAEKDVAWFNPVSYNEAKKLWNSKHITMNDLENLE